MPHLDTERPPLAVAFFRFEGDADSTPPPALPPGAFTNRRIRARGTLPTGKLPGRRGRVPAGKQQRSRQAVRKRDRNLHESSLAISSPIPRQRRTDSASPSRPTKSGSSLS